VNFWDGTLAELSILAITAFATSILSGTLGLAGGMVLLATLLLFLPPLVAIPLHGIVQLVSNGSRAALQWRHVDRAVFARFALVLVPASFAGLRIAQTLPAAALEIAICVFVLASVWLPLARWLGMRGDVRAARRRFVALGAVAGVLNPALGATGPLLAPFYLGLGLTRQGIVGTQAACQMAGHLAKIGAYGAAGFAFREHVSLLALLSLLVVAGTWVGTKLLDRVDEARFRALYRAVLTGIALWLVASNLASAFGG
jgi:uncharacterized membrane protein YfcA